MGSLCVWELWFFCRFECECGFGRSCGETHSLSFSLGCCWLRFVCNFVCLVVVAGNAFAITTWPSPRTMRRMPCKKSSFVRLVTVWPLSVKPYMTLATKKI